MSLPALVRSLLGGVAIASAIALAPTAAIADPHPSQVVTPLAKCAPSVPVRPTVNGIKIRPAVVPVNGNDTLGNISWNIATPTKEGEGAYTLLGIYEWGFKRFGLLGLDSTGCTANKLPFSVMGLEKSGGPVEWKPNTLYTVYVLQRFSESTPEDPPLTSSWADTLKFFRTTPLLKAPAAVFWTKAAPVQVPTDQ